MSIASAASLVIELIRIGRDLWKIDASINNPQTNNKDVWSEIRSHIKDENITAKIHDKAFLSALANRGGNASAILASVGANAPYIGLLGTVIGIYGALERISGGIISIQEIASPVGEALAMTAIGLLVAIPAVMSYNFIIRAKVKLNRMMENYCNALRVYGVDKKIDDREINRTVEKVQKIKKMIRKSK